MDYEATEISAGVFDISIPLVKVEDEAELLFQQVDLLLSTYADEFVYDTTLAMPYSDILGKQINASNLEAIYYAKMSKLINFSAMKDFTAEKTRSRELKISFTVIASNKKSKNFIFIG